MRVSTSFIYTGYGASAGGSRLQLHRTMAKSREKRRQERARSSLCVQSVHEQYG
ncbi:hypothetical protein [Oryza sativa Japonica Group]|uniref:Uncharacterized protein n=1 Tax=Oryza sativa subsp. japonica TaxID=39947 RepID=Q5N9X1_ORYSJ|nr:hypothetical protein [Oryza sativa Japonica Group]